MQSLLIGLADIALIPTHVDTFKIAEILGYDYAAWLGGVNVVQPLFRQAEMPTFRRLVPDQIAGINDPETEVLSLVTHRMNLPLSWTLVSPSVVEAERRSRSLTARLTAAKETGEVAEYVRLLESEVASADERVSSLTSAVESGEADVAFWEGQAADLETELKEQKFSNSQLQVALSSVGNNETSGAITAIRENIRRAVVNAPTLEDGLAIVGTAFADRLTILESARRSAVDARAFRYGERAFELLWLLATSYWDSLSQGNGDVEARKCFGQAYAATESETVTKNSRAMAKRTFSYRGVQVAMTKHLKVGVKDSVAETWRCHFEWIPDEQRIVIGHCGSHLDFR